MKIIVDHKDRKVLYDNKKKIYIKQFKPKIKNRIKYFLKFRKYPGINFNFVAKELEKIGILVPKIVSYSKYEVTMSDINGESLKEYLNKKNDEKIIKKYLDILIKILNNNIYYRDLGPGNFMYKDGEIYAIDLEGYIVRGFFSGRRKELKDRLQKGLKNDQWVNYVLNNLK